MQLGPGVAGDGTGGAFDLAGDGAGGAFDSVIVYDDVPFSGGMQRGNPRRGRQFPTDRQKLAMAQLPPLAFSLPQNSVASAMSAKPPVRMRTMVRPSRSIFW